MTKFVMVGEHRVLGLRREKQTPEREKAMLSYAAYEVRNKFMDAGLVDGVSCLVVREELYGRPIVSAIVPRNTARETLGSVEKIIKGMGKSELAVPFRLCVVENEGFDAAISDKRKSSPAGAGEARYTP